MIYHHAEINEAGVQAVCELAETPARLDCDPSTFLGTYLPENQFYIPGLSLPGIPVLEEPFAVPLIGDNESYSLCVDWAQKMDAPYLKRISFVGVLPAEPIFRNIPEDFEELTDEDPKLNAPFDDLSEWGGFLRTVVQITSSPETYSFSHNGEAGFYIFENEEENEAIHQILKSGFLSASEIVSIFRIPGAESLISEKLAEQ